MRKIHAPTLVALAALALLAGCAGDDDTTAAEEVATATTGESTTTQEAGQPLSPAEEHGRELFVQNCGACHTLDAAGTQGQIGPNLDEQPVDREQVLRAIEIGGRGSGNMPPGLVQGQDAEDVASFVTASNPAPG